MAYRNRKKKNNSTVVETEDVQVVKPTVVGDQGYPAWANWVYVKWGYIPGVIVFVLATLLVWPTALALIWALITIIASQFVGGFPDEMIKQMGLNAPVVMPVYFMTFVLALLVTAVVRKVVWGLWLYTVSSAKGLFLGHGESPWTNMKRRRAERKQRGSRRTEEVKAARAKKKAEKKKARHQVAEAKALDPSL